MSHMPANVDVVSNHRTQGAEMRIASYFRISTDEERQPYSLEAQRDKLDAYIASQDGWKLVRTYSDQTSGKTLERPGLGRALGDAKDGCYDLLLVFKVDRLARSVAGLARILEGLDSCGVSFRSASEPFDTSTPAGRMMVQMLGVFAEFEREMIVERTKMGLAKKASKGEWTGGTPPFGYRYLPERRILVPVPSDARVVREIFERYVERRSGSVAVSNWLNDSRRVTRRGSRWTPKTVLDVLRNATYTGKLPFNGDLYQAEHEPIIDEQTFGRAQKLLEQRAESLPSRAANASDYLLTGLLQCDRCGHGFIGTAAHGRGGIYRYYTCYSRQRHGTARCDQERIPAEPLEEAIVAEALAALDDGSIFLEAARKADEARTAARSDEEAERGELSGEIASKREAPPHADEPQAHRIAPYASCERPRSLRKRWAKGWSALVRMASGPCVTLSCQHGS